MNPWIAKAVILAASVVMVVFEHPTGAGVAESRSRGVAKGRASRPADSRMDGVPRPLIWVVCPVFSFAEYALRPWPFGVGVVCLAGGLWWFHRSHSDLGTYWSVTLELRENHRLITQGVYRYVRHPMYTALFLYSIGQALVLPNWVVGPSLFGAIGMLFALRIGARKG